MRHMLTISAVLFAGCACPQSPPSVGTCYQLASEVCTTCHPGDPGCFEREIAANELCCDNPVWGTIDAAAVERCLDVGPRVGMCEPPTGDPDCGALLGTLQAAGCCVGC